MATAQALLLVRGTSISSRAVMMVIAFSSAPMPTPSARMSLNTSRSTPLAAFFSRARSQLRPGLGGEPDAEEAGPGGLGEDVDGAHEVEREGLAVAAARSCRPPRRAA